MINDDNPTTSSGFACETTCHPACHNLYHPPDYKTYFTSVSPNYPVNYLCNNDFLFFIFLVVEAIIVLCDDFVRLEILCHAFLVVVRSVYNDLIDNFKDCRRNHLNAPPNHFCLSCHEKFVEAIILTISEYGIKVNAPVGVESTKIYQKIMLRWASCPNCNAL